MVSEEQLTLSQAVPAAPKAAPLPEWFHVENGKVRIDLPGGGAAASADEYTLLYRAATDNDTNPFFQNTMAPYAAQAERVVSTEPADGGFTVVTEVKNRKAKFTVTDTYRGVEGGVLVTSRLHCESGGGSVPRFGKCFRLDSRFDDVEYVGRTGESYCDMKEQFPIRKVRCAVADMTEPNIKPQESGNRCDCTMAAVGDGRAKVTFRAVGKPFELGIKPYTDRALCAMKHRKDEARTGTYVTVQAFQMGIGTGACGPATLSEYLYPAKQDYEFSFVISVE